MTRKEFYEKVITLTEDIEVQEIAKTELKKLEKKAIVSAKTKVQKALEYKPYEEKIEELLKEKPMLSSEIAEKIELSSPKTVAILNHMVESEIVIGKMVKVKKVGNRKQWSLL